MMPKRNSFQYWKNESKREVVQLFEADDDDRNNINDITNKETKKVIPSSGQGITVNKRIVKLGELTPSKNKVIENEKINIDTIKEKATLRYHDGNTRIL
jgi:hypothetical protein